jgi:hypothetical protein
VTVQLASRIRKARKPGQCALCAAPVRVGQQIGYLRGLVPHRVRGRAELRRHGGHPVTDDQHAEALDTIFSVLNEAEEHLGQASEADGWGHGGVPEGAAVAYQRAAQAMRRCAKLLDQLAAQPAPLAAVTNIRRTP